MSNSSNRTGGRSDRPGRGRRLLLVTAAVLFLLLMGTAIATLIPWLFPLNAAADSGVSLQEMAPRLPESVRETLDTPKVNAPAGTDGGRSAVPTTQEHPRAASTSGGPAGQRATEGNRLSGERLNILLLGTDRRLHQEGAPSRSDTMIVVSVDEAGKRVAMISIPRDLWVEIPGFHHERINAAHAIGEAQGYPGGGPALAMRTVEHNLGIRIDHYARVDLQGFKNVIDTLGGVTIEVTQPITDDAYPGDSGKTSIHIPAGTHHMDGDLALQYVRSRQSGNDIDRTERQQKLLMAIRDRGMRLDVIPRIPALVGAVLDSVDTDMPLHKLLSLTKLAREIDSSNVRQLVIGWDLVTPFVGEGGAALLMPNHEGIRAAIDQVMEGDR